VLLAVEVDDQKNPNTTDTSLHCGVFDTGKVGREAAYESSFGFTGICYDI
jgi:hypothetical protein